MKFLIVLCLASTASWAAAQNRNGYALQSPQVWDALRALRGGRDLTVDEQFELIKNAVPGRDYPINAYVPATGFTCVNYHQSGFYADVSDPSHCQVFHRCDINGIQTSYLCPNGTLFNQITLICDWFFNVNCGQAPQYYDYSNSRLYNENAPLLDDQLDIYGVTGAVAAVKQAPPPAPKPAPRQPVPVPARPQVAAPRAVQPRQPAAQPAPAAPVFVPRPQPVAQPQPVAPQPAQPAPQPAGEKEHGDDDDDDDKKEKDDKEKDHDSKKKESEDDD